MLKLLLLAIPFLLAMTTVSLTRRVLAGIVFGTLLGGIAIELLLPLLPGRPGIVFWRSVPQLLAQVLIVAVPAALGAGLGALLRVMPATPAEPAGGSPATAATADARKAAPRARTRVPSVRAPHLPGPITGEVVAAAVLAALLLGPAVSAGSYGLAPLATISSGAAAGLLACLLIWLALWRVVNRLVPITLAVTALVLTLVVSASLPAPYQGAVLQPRGAWLLPMAAVVWAITAGIGHLAGGATGARAAGGIAAAAGVPVLAVIAIGASWWFSSPIASAMRSGDVRPLMAEWAKANHDERDRAAERAAWARLQPMVERKPELWRSRRDELARDADPAIRLAILRLGDSYRREIGMPSDEVLAGMLADSEPRCADAAFHAIVSDTLPLTGDQAWGYVRPRLASGTSREMARLAELKDTTVLDGVLVRALLDPDEAVRSEVADYFRSGGRGFDERRARVEQRLVAAAAASTPGVAAAASALQRADLHWEPGPELLPLLIAIARDPASPQRGDACAVILRLDPPGAAAEVRLVAALVAHGACVPGLDTTAELRGQMSEADVARALRSGDRGQVLGALRALSERPAPSSKRDGSLAPGDRTLFDAIAAVLAGDDAETARLAAATIAREAWRKQASVKDLATRTADVPDPAARALLAAIAAGGGSEPAARGALAMGGWVWSFRDEERAAARAAIAALPQGLDAMRAALAEETTLLRKLDEAAARTH